MEPGGSGLEKEDNFLLEINLEYLESISFETHEYWLLAILVAQEALLLREQSSVQTSDFTISHK